MGILKVSSLYIIYTKNLMACGREQTLRLALIIRLISDHWQETNWSLAHQTHRLRACKPVSK
jgi:hypothetical protein